ncbi:hypothetical protein TRICI_003241 [Trichomonascus ciferrii]|uniref:Nuclear distribution protein PAC1 n=1 Tax=Trichomonascus ciferrii TaxID=44093 RepID=A0A642V492_9ASCO|nr:hypothetical protein TRICI_003241 [Trichomonascus ciferrii]
MPSLLTEKQRTELNRTVLSYLATTRGVSKEDVRRIQEELAPDEAELLESEEEMQRQGQILEKKWTSVVRLQRKVLDLESQIANLKLELENAGPGRKKNADPLNWLPRLPAKYSLSGHRQPITAIAFHSVFSVIASASEDGSIKIWDWELGELERTIKGHTKSVVDIDFGGPLDEILLASCSSDLSIKLWDPQNDYANIKTLTGHDHTISSVRFTPQGTHLLSASRDCTVRIWDVKSGYAVRTIHGHSEWVKTVAPSLDGQFVLSAGIDQSARIASFLTGEGKLAFIGHEHVIEHAIFAPKQANPFLAALEGLKEPIESAFSHSFDYIATASRDKTIKIWNARQEVVKTLVGHDNWVRQLAFHPSGKYLISVSDDKSIRCWDLSQMGRCVKTIPDAHNHFISCIRWAPEISSVNDDQSSSTNEQPPPPNNNNDTNDSSNGALSKKNTIRCVLATGSVDLDVKIWL